MKVLLKRVSPTELYLSYGENEEFITYPSPKEAQREFEILKRGVQHFAEKPAKKARFVDPLGDRPDTDWSQLITQCR